MIVYPIDKDKNKNYPYHFKLNVKLYKDNIKFKDEIAEYGSKNDERNWGELEYALTDWHYTSPSFDSGKYKLMLIPLESKFTYPSYTSKVIISADIAQFQSLRLKYSLMSLLGWLSLIGAVIVTLNLAVSKYKNKENLLSLWQKRSK